MTWRRSSSPWPVRALTGSTGTSARAYCRDNSPARAASRSHLFTTRAASMPCCRARTSSRSTSSRSGAGTGAATISSSSTLATGGRTHTVLRGRISSTQPCSSSSPGVKRISSPTRGESPRRRNFFLQRRTYASPAGVRAVYSPPMPRTITPRSMPCVFSVGMPPCSVAYSRVTVRW